MATGASTGAVWSATAPINGCNPHRPAVAATSHGTSDRTVAQAR